ncbi:SDR family NAD(P)-dependent oxidoreductase [Rhodoluna sp.]|uniref:SDR family NAD(P)-dependent oxidoreductase n=1 Tax=Rhodoluna sp. TaxID=1969481 RepID=UPI0025E92DB3|nr:SDR family NAD(P)-dependent oxidoreductase [Rhodoluna sp.]
MNIASKTFLVVGANGTLGHLLANQLLAKGAVVIGTARSPESSQGLAPNLTERLLLDLESSPSIEALTNYLLNQHTTIDGIIFASGLVAFGSIEEMPGSVFDRLLRVNTTGQVELFQKLIGGLKTSAANGGEPFVVSISGVIAESPMAGMSAYSASKIALKGFAQAASKELRKQGIRWIDARPGHTETGLASRAIFGSAPNFGSGLDAQIVAQRIVQAIENDERDLPSTAF